MSDTITSVSNKKVQHIKSLLKNRADRYEYRQFVIEGVNIVKDIPTGIEFELYYTKDRYGEIAHLIDRATSSYEVSDKVMNAMCDTVTPSGMLAVVRMKDEEIPESIGNKVIFLDGIKDPGNMGTIIRTAVALGVEDIIAVDSVDVYSPKVIRSTMGGIFNTTVINIDRNKALELILDYKVYILDMNGENIFDRDFNIDNKKFVLAVGSEAHGISDMMRSRADRVLSLPMTDKIESLNAGVSLTTALYRILYI